MNKNQIKCNLEELLDECENLYMDGNCERLLEVTDEILKLSPDNQTAIGYKARCLYLMGQLDEALTLLNNAIILYPGNVYFLSIKADVLMDREEYGKAARCFEKMLEMDVSDDDINFIKNEYGTCLSLWRDQLIENEKYVDAWQCFNRMAEIKSDNLKRPELIERFKEYVKKYTSRVKYRQYHVKLSSKKAKVKLIKFLNDNGFKGGCESGSLFLIDVVDKTYCSLSVDKVGDNRIISESKFYDKVNYYPRDRIVYRKLHDEDGNMVYEGYTLDYSPYGFGKAYFSDGSLYREGIFDIKGIVQGKEYYPSGGLRFKGQWCLTRGYGPNAPCDGEAYDEKGDLIYSGKFEIRRGGVGWPMILNPKGFGLEQKHRPKIDYYKNNT